MRLRVHILALVVLARATSCLAQSPAASVTDDWHRELERIQRVHFASGVPAAERSTGLRIIGSISDPRAFQPMVERFNGSADDIRLAMLDGFARHGAAGQAALAWTAIHARDPALRNEATLRLDRPAPREVLLVLDAALRHRNRAVAANGARLVNLLDVTEAIPLLIDMQMISVRDEVVEGFSGGGLIRSGQQISYVANVIPVFGPGSVAYQPVVGTVNEGFAVDSGTGVRLACRTEIHDALVRLTTRDHGSSTAALGYDSSRWHEWYQGIYLPTQAARRAARGAVGAGGPASP